MKVNFPELPRMVILKTKGSPTSEHSDQQEKAEEFQVYFQSKVSAWTEEDKRVG